MAKHECANQNSFANESLNCSKNSSYFCWPCSAENRSGYTFLTQISLASDWLFKIDMASSMNSSSGATPHLTILASRDTRRYGA
jgi:hypothetical protein